MLVANTRQTIKCAGRQRVKHIYLICYALFILLYCKDIIESANDNNNKRLDMIKLFLVQHIYMYYCSYFLLNILNKVDNKLSKKCWEIKFKVNQKKRFLLFNFYTWYFLNMNYSSVIIFFIIVNFLFLIGVGNKIILFFLYAVNTSYIRYEIVRLCYKTYRNYFNLFG